MADFQESYDVARPGIHFDPGIEGDDRVALELVQTVVATTPEALGEVVDLYGKDPDTVASVLDYLHENPERWPILEALVRVMTQQLDLQIEYDPGTEEAIENDPYYLSIKRDFQLTTDETKRDLYRKQMRARRWKILIQRSRTAA